MSEILKIGGAVAACAASVMLALALAGCDAAPAEEATVREALEAELGLIERLDGEFVSAAAAGMGDDLKAYGVEAVDFVAAYLEDFAYEVRDIETIWDRATAEVTMASGPCRRSPSRPFSTLC